MVFVRRRISPNKRLEFSGLNWELDRNSSFFFKSVAKCRNINSTSTITLVDGFVTTNEDLIKSEAITYFSNLLGSPSIVTHSNQDFLRSIVGNPLSNSQSVALSNVLSSDEIRDACFNRNPNKAPGPDGFNVSASPTFKFHWRCLKK